MGMLEKLRDEKLEKLKTRHFGIWRGVVTNVNDPLNLGRIKARVHELLGDTDETNWASYCAPYGGRGAGWYFLPAPDDGVWIMFEAGDINRPIWVGCWYSEADPRPQGAEKDVRVLQTRAGHRIVFDDNPGAEKIRMQDSKGQYVEWQASDNLITIKANNKVLVKAPKVEIGDETQLSGIVTSNTHKVCLVTGLPIGHSLTVKGAS